MRPCVESNCEGGLPWRCNLGNMQIEERGGGGPQGGEGERSGGGGGESQGYNGQGALEEQRLTGESGKVGPRRGTAVEY